MARRRRSLSVYISNEALGGWRLFARANGTTVTGLVEVLGLHLDAMDVANREWRRIIGDAQAVDAERRSRLPE